MWWRIDAEAPELWSWAGFAEARNRFDPETATFRVRYAARSATGAARERYLGTGRYIPSDHGSHHLVRLEADRPLRILDLRTEANLDALGVDDRISTGRESQVWTASHRLAGRLRTWWSDLDGIIYRSRTTPASSVNLAFFASTPFRAESRFLAHAPELLSALVLDHGFTIGFDF